MTPEDADKTIESMKEEAKKLGPEYVAWRESSEMLVNCRDREADGFEWRIVRTAEGPGREISEETARRHFRTVTGWIGGPDATPLKLDENGPRHA